MVTDPATNGVLTSAGEYHHIHQASMGEWTPLPRIGRGVAIGRYSPHADSAVSNIDTPLNVGDEVYIFESHSSGKWFRGYIVTSPRAQAAFNQPLPKSKKINNAALKSLDLNIATGVFPTVIVSIKEWFDFTPEEKESIESQTSQKPQPPAIPALRLGIEQPTMEGEPLVDDITSVIKEWYNTYVYHHFLHGDYSLVTTIQEIIKDLYDIRRKLMYGLLTNNERVIARKKAVWQIARVTKMLKRGIVVREPNTGDILSGRDGPVKLAQEQMLLALAPNYPDHAVVGDIVKEATVPKHILVDFKSCVGQGYGHGLTVHLHLRTKTHQLTESFKVKVSADTELTDLSAVLFRDLPISITKDDVFLIAKVYEDVTLRSQTGGATVQALLNSMPNRAPQIAGPNGNGTVPVQKEGRHKDHKGHGKRGVAAGAADVSRLFRMEESVESPFTIRMFGSYFGQNEPNDENRGWGELVDRIVRGRPRGVAVTPRAEQVVCTVKEFEGPSVANIENLASEDSHRAIGFAKSLFVNSLSEPRDDVYIHLGKLSLTSTQVVVRDLLLVTLSSSSGQVLFSEASNSPGSSTWDSVAVFNNEVVGEMVGASNFEKNEIVYLNLYVGGQYFGQGSIPLWHGNRVWSGKRAITFIRDGANVATINTLIDFVGNGYNTDLAIDKILNWKIVYEKNGSEELSNTLAKFKVVEDTEFLKRFHDILDSLFDMLAHFMNIESEEFLLQLFHAMIYTLEKVTARSKEHKYLGDDYMDNRFNFAGMSEILLSLTEKCLLNTSSLGYQLLINLFKVSEYISRLIATSAAIDADRGKETQANVSIAIRKYMKRITDAIKNILCKPDRGLIELQIVAVQNLFEWYDNLKQFLPSDETAQLMIEAIDSIRTDQDKINTQRLLLIKRLSESSLYKQAKYRPHITAYTIKWTLQFWVDTSDFTIGRKEQLRLLSGIFAAQFRVLWPVRYEEPEVCKRYGQLLPIGAKLYTELLNHWEQNRRTSCTVFSPLFPSKYPFEVRAVDSMVTQTYFDETLIELGIVFTLLVNIAHFSGHHLPDSSLSEDQVCELASNIIRACTAMLNCVSFPRTWISLLAVHHETVLGCLDYLSTLMKTRFIPAPDDADTFNATVWHHFLSCILQLAGSEHIAVEHLPEQKRVAIWKITGDIRSRAVTLLKDVWDSIGWPASMEDKARFGIPVFGGFQVQMFGGETSLVREVLNLCLVRHPSVQEAAVHILQTMIVSEWNLNEDLSGLQREMIASLDDIFQARTYLPEQFEKKNFSFYLRNSNIDVEDEAFPAIPRLMDDVEEFLDLLLDLYNIPPGDAFNDDRIFHALNVLNFLKDIDRVEIFSRYVNDIATWNRSKLNYTQTGLALKLLASAYEWSYDIKLEASEHPPFPAQSSFERKEALYEDIIQNFTRGKAFEQAIAATKELVQAYETVAYDFKKLASATRILAKLYDSVDNVDRLQPAYFRVSYIGIGFPRSLRNRQFIFEGTPWEKLETIHERLHKIYPGANIVSREQDAKNDGQYLFVSTVSPDQDIRDSIAGLPATSQGAKEYIARMNMRFFSYSRPLPGNTSPLDLWVEKTTYETYQSFPTIVKRSEVKEVTVVRLSPLENALHLMESKTAELVDLEQQFKTGKADQGTVSRLDLVLSGSVDSPVNGGIQIYRSFLEDDTLKLDPSTSHFVSSLEIAFLDYAAAIQRCLAIHGKVVPATLRPLHESLNQLFQRNFAPELAMIGSDSYEEARRVVISRQESRQEISRQEMLSRQEVFQENGNSPLSTPNLNNSASSLHGSSRNDMYAASTTSVSPTLSNGTMMSNSTARNNASSSLSSRPQMVTTAHTSVPPTPDLGLGGHNSTPSINNVPGSLQSTTNNVHVYRRGSQSSASSRTVSLNPQQPRRVPPARQALQQQQQQQQQQQLVSDWSTQNTFPMASSGENDQYSYYRSPSGI